VNFRVLGKISQIESIAAGRGIRERRRLRKLYGGQRWKKLKGAATIQMMDGTICLAELHWYQAHGVGSREIKIKRILEFL
jgi:hypothetical protein